MRLACVVLSLALPWSALADGDRSFTQLRDSAEKFDGSLSAFLERYVGVCPSSEGARECREAAGAFRKNATGKKYFFIIGEEQVSSLAPGRVMSNGEYTLGLTPFFPAGNFAVSQGAPHHLDARGNPVFPVMMLKGKSEDSMEAQRVMREVSNRNVRVELVFTPQGVWALPSRKGDKLQGVRATFNAVQATSGSSGKSLASAVK